MEEKQRIRSLVKLLAAVIVSLASYVLIGLVAESWSRPVYDLLFRLRGPLPTDNDIVIVTIDELSFDQLNMQWPWPRHIHAKLIDALFAAGAKAVALDIVFSEPTNEEDDKALAEAVERHADAVVLGTDVRVDTDPVQGFVQTKILTPDPLLEQMKILPRLGLVSIVPERDGYLRRLCLKFPEPEGLAFAAEAAASFRGVSSNEALANHDYALKWINFSGPAGSIRTIPYYLALGPKTDLPEGVFENKLVFVGLAMSSPADIYTPTADRFLVPFSRDDSAYFPGVEVHANAARSILENDFIKVLEPAQATYAGVVLGFASSLLFLTLSPLFSTMVFAAGGMLLALITVFLFSIEQLEIAPVYLSVPLTVSYLSSVFVHYWFTYKQKAFIRKAFSTYLAPSLVAELINHPERLELGGQVREGTVVFLDLAGFTGFSEKLTPKELIDLLNRNLGACAELILKWEGMIDKYIGDCIMAVWGVPVPSDHHAFNAVSAVWEVFESMKILAGKERELTGVGLSIRVGINSGSLIAGNVGGGQQFNYTVLGNEVNLASRLEGTNKAYHTEIIVSEATKLKAGDSFVYREVDIIRVLGQNVPVKIFQLWGVGKMSEEQSTLDAVFQQGRAFYHAKDWAQAKKKFEEALLLNPKDGPSETFMTRCDEYALIPPPEDWDGVHQMTSK